MESNAVTPTSGELYVRAMAMTNRYIAGVRTNQWTAPTPCTEWSVRDVVNHLAYENLWAVELFQGKTIVEVGRRFDGDLVGSDPARAYATSAALARAAIEAPGVMEMTCHLSFGDFPGSEYAWQLFCDTLLHGWDIAKATGQDTRLDADLVAACLPHAVRLRRTRWRRSTLFAPAVDVPPDADPQTRLLALAGRRA